jgi:hypothetical protein
MLPFNYYINVSKIFQNVRWWPSSCLPPPRLLAAGDAPASKDKKKGFFTNTYLQTTS